MTTKEIAKKIDEYLLSGQYKIAFIYVDIMNLMIDREIEVYNKKFKNMYDVLYNDAHIKPLKRETA